MRHEERGVVERLIVVDGELTDQLDLVGRCLLTPLADPGTVAGRPPVTDPAAASEALRRLTETVSEAVARGPRVWAPNGRWEHAGLRLVRLSSADVDVLYAVLRELSGALAAPAPADGDAGAPGRLTALLAELATAAGQTPAALVGALARVLATVDLVPDGDTALLALALRAADGEDVRLTSEQEEAWQRLAHRVTMVLTESVPLHRFLG